MSRHRVMEAAMSPTWGWRRGPSCDRVPRASDFEGVQPYQGWGQGEIRRHGPYCWYQERTWEFAELDRQE